MPECNKAVPETVLRNVVSVAFADVETVDYAADQAERFRTLARQQLKRDFVYKLEKAGFIDVRVLHREPVSIDDCALYPLFTDEVISLMRQLIPPQKQQAVAVAVVITASTLL